MPLERTPATARSPIRQHRGEPRRWRDGSSRRPAPVPPRCLSARSLAVRVRLSSRWSSVTHATQSNWYSYCYRPTVDPTWPSSCRRTRIPLDTSFWHARPGNHIRLTDKPHQDGQEITVGRPGVLAWNLYQTSNWRE